MNIKELLKENINLLKENKIEESNLIAKTLLAFVLKVNKQYLLINESMEIDKKQIELYAKSIKEIIQGKPLQYITHNQEFMKLNFYVDKNVLIPQPDTEILVENVLDICDNNVKLQNCKAIKILDLCTGSGAIAISLDNYVNNTSKIYASDISKEALKVASKNAKNNNSNVVFIESDLFNNIKDSESNNMKFDIIVSNPPYIETYVLDKLPNDVKCEPLIALDGGDNGLLFYKKIITQAVYFLNNDGFLCFEIGYNQKDKVIKMFIDNGNYTDIKSIKDLSGNDRCVIAKNQSINKQ